MFNDKSAPPCGLIFPLTVLFIAKIHVGISGGQRATGLSLSPLLQTLPKWANLWGGGVKPAHSMTPSLSCCHSVGLSALSLVVEVGDVPPVAWEMLPVTPNFSSGLLPLGTQCWDPGDLTTDHRATFLPLVLICSWMSHLTSLHLILLMRKMRIVIIYYLAGP